MAGRVHEEVRREQAWPGLTRDGTGPHARAGSAAQTDCSAPDEGERRGRGRAKGTRRLPTESQGCWLGSRAEAHEMPTHMGHFRHDAVATLVKRAMATRPPPLPTRQPRQCAPRRHTIRYGTARHGTAPLEHIYDTCTGTHSAPARGHVTWGGDARRIARQGDDKKVSAAPQTQPRRARKYQCFPGNKRVVSKTQPADKDALPGAPRVSRAQPRDRDNEM